MTQLNTAEVTLERDGDQVFITLSNPGKLNALTVSMWGQLQAHMKAVSQDLDVRAVIIRGADRQFAAGADISEFQYVRTDLDSVMHYHTKVLAPALQEIAHCPHPVIAQIEGVCVGGGLEIAVQCDLRIAGQSARFGAPTNKLGLPMAPEEIRTLLSLAGPAVTRELLLEGRVFSAAEAREKGLLTRIVDDGEVAAEVLRAAARISDGGPLAARLNKQMINRLLKSDAPLSIGELHDFFRYAETNDHKEGVRAFLAGESPTFTGD